MGQIDNIINQLRQKPIAQGSIYVNKNTYDIIQEEIQENDYDYNSSTIIALNNLILAIDVDLKDGEIEIR